MLILCCYVLQIQLYNGLGQLTGVNTLGPNDLGVAPRGIGHFIKNAGLTPMLPTRAAAFPVLAKSHSFTP